jgi:23S rRNA pseudouridine955/2504/2580 synthase/23S rRNA pseudouridine1911/1915/1917 synthase
MNIIFENEDIIAIDKPSGLLSIPDREGREVSLKALLADKYDQVFTVHRLDRDTSGLIVFAKNEAAHRHLSMQFEERQTEKIYRGLVLGSPLHVTGTIDKPIAENTVTRGVMLIHPRGKNAITDFHVIEDFGIYSFLEFQIHTGRTHQIRIHMKDMGHPIVCDPVYGDGKPILLSAIKPRFKLSKKEEVEKPILGRLALHAFRLTIKDMKGNPLEMEAPLPKDIRATLQQLEKIKKRK